MQITLCNTPQLMFKPRLEPFPMNQRATLNNERKTKMKSDFEIVYIPILCLDGGGGTHRVWGVLLLLSWTIESDIFLNLCYTCKRNSCPSFYWQSAHFESQVYNLVQSSASFHWKAVVYKAPFSFTQSIHTPNLHASPQSGTKKAQYESATALTIMYIGKSPIDDIF